MNDHAYTIAMTMTTARHAVASLQLEQMLRMAGAPAESVSAVIDAVHSGQVQKIGIQALDDNGILTAEIVFSGDFDGTEQGVSLSETARLFSEYSTRTRSSRRRVFIQYKSTGQDAAMRSKYTKFENWTLDELPELDADITLVDEGSSSRTEEVIAVNIYIDTEDPDVSARVFHAVDELVEAMGYEFVGPTKIERGSIFRKSKAIARKVLESEELNSRLVKVERAIELAVVDAKQADVDGKEAEAVSKLLASISDVPQACFRIGSILLIKYTEPSGPVVLVRNLSQLEIRTLERFPEIQKTPRMVLDALAAAISVTEGVTVQPPT